MEKEFTPLEQSISIFDNGYTGNSFGAYYKHEKTTEIRLFTFGDKDYHKVCTREWIWLCDAILFQQAFNFFRDEHKITSHITSCTRALGNKWKDWTFSISVCSDTTKGFNIDQRDGFETYEEAQEACIIKLIEIMNKKISQIKTSVMKGRKITITKKNVKTATDEVMLHLKTRSLTSVQAINNYGVTRLSAIIFNLRRKGYNIVSHSFEKKTRYGRTAILARYQYIKPTE